MLKLQANSLGEAPGRRERGATLIEVLISIVIMAFGMLGLAGMQAATTKFRLGSDIRIAVNELAGDISDRMRGNMEKLPGYAFGNSSNYAIKTEYATQVAATVNLTKNCATNTCTADELVKYDMELWQRTAKAKLPGGATWLTGDVQNGFDVSIMWFDKNYVDTDGVAVTTEECKATYTEIRAQRCCPADAKAPAGVRCTNFTIMP